MMTRLCTLLLLFLLAASPALAWDPSDVAGLELWLKADAIVGLNDGDDVVTWADSSGNGLDATQATEAKRPIYKTNIVNSLPVVRFEQNNDEFLAGASGTWRTVFVVTDVSSGGNYNQVWTSPPSDTCIRLDASVVYRGASGTNSGDWSYGNEALFFVNGTNTNTVPAGFHIVSSEKSAGVTNTYQVGGDYIGDRTWDGDIAEVVVYDTTVIEADRQKVEGYLAWKWGIQADLPVGHPWLACSPPGPCSSPKRRILNVGQNSEPFSWAGMLREMAHDYAEMWNSDIPMFRWRWGGR